jgi:Mg2+/Co2+ transporter CorC
MLSENDKLDYKTLANIFKSGFSRIPVYGKDKNDIKGDKVCNGMIFFYVIFHYWQVYENDYDIAIFIARCLPSK